MPGSDQGIISDLSRNQEAKASSSRTAHNITHQSCSVCCTINAEIMDCRPLSAIRRDADQIAGSTAQLWGRSHLLRFGRRRVAGFKCTYRTGGDRSGERSCRATAGHWRAATATCRGPHYRLRTAMTGLARWNGCCRGTSSHRLPRQHLAAHHTAPRPVVHGQRAWPD